MAIFHNPHIVIKCADFVHASYQISKPDLDIEICVYKQIGI